MDTIEPRKDHARIGELLVEAGLVDARAVEHALASQHQGGGALGEHLVRAGAIDDARLLRALARQTGLRWVDLTHVEIPVDVQRAIRIETARAHRVLPVAFEERAVALGMVKPDDLAAVEAVRFEAGRPVHPVLLSGAQLDRALASLAERGWGERPFRLEARASSAPLGDDLASLLRAMVAMRGQDLHLAAGAVPAVKVDNELVRLPLPPLDEERLIALLGPILSERQRAAFAERLELDFAATVPGAGRFRCNLYRQRGTVAFAARHLVEEIPTRDELGLPSFLRDFALEKQGLVLVVGPTGHGKTTTLAAMIDVINRERRANVITIEDPIELVHRHRASNVNQREVGTDTRSFAEGLRHAFRQGPDVLVVGELRDHESTSIALTAAETGHLVLATMHALNATAAVDRIVDLYPGEQQHQVRAQLSESLLLVFSQRLVRRARGAGRVVAFERMSTSLRVRAAIREGRTHALRGYMQANHEELGSIDQSLAPLVAAGTITRDEARKYADAPAYLDDLLRARGVVVP